MNTPISHLPFRAMTAPASMHELARVLDSDEAVSSALMGVDSLHDWNGGLADRQEKILKG